MVVIVVVACCCMCVPACECPMCQSWQKITFTKALSHNHRLYNTTEKLCILYKAPLTVRERGAVGTDGRCGSSEQMEPNGPVMAHNHRLYNTTEKLAASYTKPLSRSVRGAQWAPVAVVGPVSRWNQTDPLWAITGPFGSICSLHTGGRIARPPLYTVVVSATIHLYIIFLPINSASCSS